MIYNISIKWKLFYDLFIYSLSLLSPFLLETTNSLLFDALFINTMPLWIPLWIDLTKIRIQYRRLINKFILRFVLLQFFFFSLS